MTKQQPTKHIDQPGEMLTNEQQFRSELGDLPRLSDEEAQQLLERARSGDPAARDALLLHLIRPLKAFIGRFLSEHYENVFPRFEFLDLVQEGIKAMLEVFDRALDHASPIGFLLLTAYGELRKYCKTQCSLISVPETPGVGPLPMVSLDAPLPNDETTTMIDLIAATETQPAASTLDFTPLYQAIEQLNPRRKSILIRHYGLYDHAPERLCDMARSLYGEDRHYVWMCKSYKLAALRALRCQLQDSYPQYGTDFIKPQQPRHTYEQLALTDTRREQLAEAEARLQARGEPITVMRLCREAKMGNHWASLYLHNRQALSNRALAHCEEVTR